MPRESRDGISARMRQTRVRIERWRRTREKRSPMPEPLWKAAIALAETEGVYRTARALSLDYQSLRSRLAGARPAGRRGLTAPPGFVELGPPWTLPAAGVGGPVLELVEPGGAKLTIRLPGGQGFDLEGLVRRLLEGGRR